MTPVGSTANILVTEQRSSRILLVDLDGHVLRSWSAPDDVTGWGLPNEAKARIGPRGPVVLATDSYGFASVFDAEGSLLWSTDLTRAADPHSIELLPDGAVAVAASVGGRVDIHRGLAAGADSLLVSVALRGAHGLAWQAEKGVLWAVGDDHLVAWRWDPASGGLTELARTVLPTREGHDLHWVDETQRALWVTTRSGVYQRDVRSGAWAQVASGGVADLHDVKSIGGRDGTLLYTRADEEWWTSTLRFAEPAFEIELPGTRVYKARWAGGMFA